MSWSPDWIADQIFLLPGHKIRVKGAVFGHRPQQKLPQKPHHGREDLIACHGEAVFHKGAGKPGGLVVAHPAHQCANGSAVQVIQPVGDGAQIRGRFAAPQQHRGQEGIQRRLLMALGTDELKAQASLPEPGVPAAPKCHTGQ